MLGSFGSRGNTYQFTDSQYSWVVMHLRRYLQTVGLTTSRQNFSCGDKEHDYRNIFGVGSGIPTCQADKVCNPANNNSCNLFTLLPGKFVGVVAGANPGEGLNKS